jgi:hemolysin activation/secretion protein
MTSGPLISNEQLIAGGADSVRGYMEAEQAGDDGTRGTLELRGPQWGECSINDLHGLAFVDAAHLRVRSPLPAQQANSNLSSFGVGLRAQSSDGWNLRLDVGFPRKSTLYTQANKAHVAFRMSASF